MQIEVTPYFFNDNYSKIKNTMIIDVPDDADEEEIKDIVENCAIEFLATRYRILD